MSEILAFFKEPKVVIAFVIACAFGGFIYISINSGGFKVSRDLNNQGGSINNNSNNGGNQTNSNSGYSIFGNNTNTTINNSNPEDKNVTDDLDIEGDIYFAKRCKPNPEKGDKFNKEAIISLSQYSEITAKTNNGHFHISAKNIIYSEQVPILVNNKSVYPAEVPFRKQQIDIIFGCN